MKEHKITSIEGYIRLINSQRSDIYGYRGVSNKNHKLIPSAGRVLPKHAGISLIFEYEMFSEFMREMPIFEPNKTDLEYAIIAQHHGLPTRLLDWTTNPLVALYFSSISRDGDTDGCVYCLKDNVRKVHEKDINYTKMLVKSPDKRVVYSSSAPHLQLSPYFDKITQDLFGFKYAIFKPHSITQRVSRQMSFFTIHSNPFSPIEDDILLKIIIKKKFKEGIIDELSGFGINTYSLFPCVEGLAAELKRSHFANLTEEDLDTSLD